MRLDIPPISKEQIEKDNKRLLDNMAKASKEVAAQHAIRSGRLCDPSDDVVAVPVTDVQAKALKLQADCAGIATLEPTQARHVAGQAAFVNPRLAHLLALAAELDHRGFEAVLACAMFHRRYPKGA